MRSSVAGRPRAQKWAEWEQGWDKGQKVTAKIIAPLLKEGDLTMMDYDEDFQGANEMLFLTS